MPRKSTLHISEPRTTVLLKAGNPPVEAVEVFRRVFWKSEFLAGEAFSFWKEVRKAEPGGLPVQVWKDWVSKHEMSVGQFYNMIHGLLGAGIVERRESSWRLSDGFPRELKAMLNIYTTCKG